MNAAHRMVVVLGGRVMPGLLGGGGDATAPTVTLTTAATSPVVAAFSTTATFSEDVTGFVVGDITVTNGAASNFVAVSASVYTFTITPDYLGVTVSIQIGAGVCSDVTAGNANTASNTLSLTTAVYQRVLSARPASLIGLWRLNDASGSAVANDSSPNNYDGTPTAVTFAALTGPDGSPAPTLNGTTSYVDLFTSGAQADFNGAAGTVVVWFKVANAGVWTDGANRTAFIANVNASNTVQVFKASTPNNTFTFRYAAGGTTEEVTVSSYSPTDWVCAALTWDKAAEQVKAYLNGVQQGVTQTSLGIWAGALALLRIGRGGTTYWSGGLALAALWDVALTGSEVTVISTSPL